MPWTPARILAVLAGAALIAAGIALVGQRRFGRATASTEAPVAVSWWRSLSKPTRHVVEVALIVGGYHIAVYAMPGNPPLLAVPQRLWWVVPTVIAAALAGSLLVDRLERRP